MIIVSLGQTLITDTALDSLVAMHQRDLIWHTLAALAVETRDEGFDFRGAHLASATTTSLRIAELEHLKTIARRRAPS